MNSTEPSTPRTLAAAAGFLVAVIATAGFGVLMNQGNIEGWYADAEKVMWTPPNAVFGPVWTVLYLLIALAGFLLWRTGFRGRGRENANRGLLIAFIFQLALNALWSPMFFAGYPVFGPFAWWAALVIILLLDIIVATMILQTWRDLPVVAILLTPYLLWILYATTLNAGVAVLN